MAELVHVFILYSLLTFFDETESRLLTGLNENSTDSPFSTTQTTLAIVLSAIASIIVLVVVIFKCGDCYNSEVSTEFHPASNGGGPKWGGAAGYSSGSTQSGAITFGESYDPDAATQGLPYSMIPANIPESGGFAGYQTGNVGDNGTVGSGGAPLMGYQSFGAASAPAPSHSQVGRHINPAEAQEPPPSYNESLRHSSLRESR